MILLVLCLFNGFPHGVHYENGIECEECHSKVKLSKKSTDLLLPKVDVCISCHDNEMGYREPVSIFPWISKFSHNLHKNVECEKCHKNPRNPVLPEMVSCLNCHDGLKASRDCYTCHEKGETRLVEYHPPHWKSIHAEEARTGEKNCLICHQESQALQDLTPAQACENCHVRENIALQKHLENFIFLHPQAFLAREENCEDCHREFTDCRSCHREKGLYPLDHNSINWLTQNGGEHSEEARIDPERCLSCHGGIEPVCAECHGGK